MRYFSATDAEALIPELEKIFRQVRKLQEQAQARASKTRKLESDPSPAAQAELAVERSRLSLLVAGMEDALKRVVALGAVPKGLDPVLVDFPCRLDGREVFLCWTLGEKAITHYHGVEEGYAGRKPLPLH